MSKEFRAITFTHEEGMDAIATLVRAMHTDLAEARASDIYYKTTGPDITATLHIGGRAVLVEAHEITAALIRYARKSGIPLPRTARKLIEENSKELTLKLWLD